MASARIPIRREPTGSAESDRAQLLAQDHARRSRLNPLADARLIDAEPGAIAGTGLSFTAGTARSIVHGLGRPAIGFFEVYGADLASAAHVGLRATAHPSNVTSATHITVTPASSGTAWIVVF